MLEFCGWQDNPAEVERIWEMMPTPFFQAPAPDPTKDALNHLIFRQMNGFDAPNGPQKIGDCVSWGNGNLVNYTQTLEAYLQIQQAKEDGDHKKAADLTEAYEYQETCTEAIYALSRVEIGGQRGSRQDGSVGAWAAKALTDFGAISRKNLTALGIDGTYSGQRAKDWGASGLPDSLEPVAKSHPIADMTPVRSWNDLVFHTQNYRVVAVCSNVGFENGGGGSKLTVRDAQGFVRPRGTWPHCMLFASSRQGSRPGALILNQWGSDAVGGPKGEIEIPDCSWWVDAEVVDKMLKQNDSFTGTKYKGYPVRKLSWRF